MSDQVDEIREMQTFLGIREKAHTIWQSQYSREVGYEDWLITYRNELHRRCEERLAEDYLKNLGKTLFRERFHFFKEFQR